MRRTVARRAAGLRFTLDEIEDIRIAVDEACAMLLAVALPDTELRYHFSTTDDTLDVEMSVAKDLAASLPPNKSFSFQVLRVLVDNVSTEISEGGASIRLSKRHQGPTGPASQA